MQEITVTEIVGELNTTPKSDCSDWLETEDDWNLTNWTERCEVSMVLKFPFSSIVVLVIGSSREYPLGEWESSEFLRQHKETFDQKVQDGGHQGKDCESIEVKRFSCT